jgi:hypothetical protein
MDIQGIGISAQSAAAVVAATARFAGETHIPNGMMFTIGFLVNDVRIRLVHRIDPADRQRAGRQAKTTLKSGPVADLMCHISLTFSADYSIQTYNSPKRRRTF